MIVPNLHEILCIRYIVLQVLILVDLILVRLKILLNFQNDFHHLQVMQLVDTFRARVVDVALDSLMIEVTGTEDKIDGLVEVLRPYGLVEMVRTGRVAMARGSVANGSK